MSSTSSPWISFSTSSSISSNRLTQQTKNKKESKTIEGILKERFICKDIYEHWGLIWYNYHRIIKMKLPSLLTNTQWKYKKNIKMESKYISRIILTTHPDHSSKSINIDWESTTPNRHTYMEILRYGMNQYFRLVTINELIKKSKRKEKTTFVPTKFLFCFGNYQFEGKEVEDVVFSIHFPFLIDSQNENQASLIFTISLNLPSLSSSITQNQFFFEVLYDQVNMIIYKFYIYHFTNQLQPTALDYLFQSINDVISSIEKTFSSIDLEKPEMLPIEQTLPKSNSSNQFKDDFSFVSTALSAHQQTYTTICLVSSNDCLSAFMHLFEPFNAPVFLNHYYPMFFSPVILNKPIPLFSIVFTPEIKEESYLDLPFPFCIINPSTKSVDISSALSLPAHFNNRAHELLKMSIRLHSIQLQDMKSMRSCENHYSRILKNAKLSTFTMKHLQSLFKLPMNERKMLLLRYSEYLGMKGKIFLNTIMYDEISIEGNTEWIRLFQEIFECDLEGLTLILSTLKLTEPILIPKILWTIQQYEDYIKINFT